MKLLAATSSLLLALAHPAAAQFFSTFPADTSRIYSYVEQLPALPGGGGNLALVKAVQRALRLPPEVREGRTEGRVLVQVVVGVSGVPRQARIAQSLSPACDAAALAAVQRLPRLRPGISYGQPVAVLLSLPVVFYGPQHVFQANEVAQAPQFPGGDAALEAYVRQQRQTPAEVVQRDLRGRSTVRFTLKPDGRVGAVEIVKSLCGPCDDEALRLVRSLPRYRPALGYDDQPVAVQLALNIWFEPPPPPAGTPPPTPETQIYSYASQMPTLPGGAPATAAALAAALLERLDYPARATGGEVQVSFVVEPDGRITRPLIVKGLDSSLDEAVLGAALRLPRLGPAREGGRPVAVRLSVPVSIEMH